MKKFLMCCGAEKAGTTWLYEYFAKHKEYLDLGKELNLIQRDDIIPDLVGLKECRKDLNKFFDSVAILMNKSSGDFTHYEGSTENIFRIFKDGFAKRDIEVVPVYIMRDPIQRIWSAWHMIGGGDSSLQKAAETVMIPFLSCKYKETIQALDNVFDNPLYFFYEDFFKQDNINRICQALNISTVEANFDVVAKGGYDKEPDKNFIDTFCLTEKNKEAVSFVFERFKYDVPWNRSTYN